MKKVKIRLTLYFEEEVAADATKETIELRWNESGFSSSNILLCGMGCFEVIEDPSRDLLNKKE